LILVVMPKLFGACCDDEMKKRLVPHFLFNETASNDNSQPDHVTLRGVARPAGVRSDMRDNQFLLCTSNWAVIFLPTGNDSRRF